MSILIITNQDDPTTDFFEEKLKEKDISYFRFNTDLSLEMSHFLEISRDGYKNEIKLEDIYLNFKEIESIWYRRPIPPMPPKELQSSQSQSFVISETNTYLNDLWGIIKDRIWVSHPDSIRNANRKLKQLLIARTNGFRIPKTLVTNQPDKVIKFYKENNEKIVVKPFRQNSLKYSDKKQPSIYTNRVTKESLDCLNYVCYSPTFFQEEISKELEIRVTVIGREVFAAANNSQKCDGLETDWRKLTATQLQWTPYSLPNAIEEKCVNIVDYFGLLFGAIDMILTPNGEYVFLEINPNGQWAWLEIEAGIPISQSLIKLLTNNKAPNYI